jgi:predicted dehydrogenase
MTTPLAVAVAGYGYWGPNVARNVAASETTELAAICDVSEVALARATQLHPGVRVTDSLEKVLTDPRIEAIVLAVPMRLHHSLGLEALQAGKHVLVEKPLATTVAECDELLDAAATRNLTLMVGHTFLFNGAVRRVRQYLHERELGRPYYVSMRRTNLGIVRADGNAMWSLAPHDVSILRYWLPQAPLHVSATGACHLQEGIEDVVFMSITFEDGIVGHIHASWLEPNKVRDATVVGDRKMVVYDDTAPEAKLRLYDKGIDRRSIDAGDARGSGLGDYESFSRFQMIARAGDILIPKLDLREPLLLEVDHFAACVRGEAEPLADGNAGRDVVAILEAAQLSLASNGEPRQVKDQVHA